MSSPLGTYLSLLKLQFRQCLQLVRRGLGSLFREHRNHPKHSSAGDLKAFRADELVERQADSAAVRQTPEAGTVWNE